MEAVAGVLTRALEDKQKECDGGRAQIAALREEIERLKAGSQVQAARGGRESKEGGQHDEAHNDESKDGEMMDDMFRRAAAVRVGSETQAQREARQMNESSSVLKRYLKR